MKFTSTLFFLSLVASVGAQPAGTKDFTCGDGETLVFSCYQDIQEKLTSVGDSWTQDIKCGGNGCECVDSCFDDCMEPITATVTSVSDDFIIKLSGYTTGEISFKAGNEANPTPANDNGNYAYGGRKAISHIDLCLREPEPTPVCDCGEPSSPCMVMGCSNGQCIESPKPEGTSCGLAGGTTCYPEADMCDGNGVCVPGFVGVAEGTPCGNPETSCMVADSCSNGKCLTGRMKVDGTPCGDPEDECTEADTCSNGQCNTDVFKSLGTACGDQTISECHPNADTCDGAGKCKSELLVAGTSCGNDETSCMNGDSCSVDGECVPGLPKADGTSCGDAGDECNAADTCNNGVCVTEIFMAAGTPCGSSENSVCNKPDVCDGNGKCLPNLEAEGTVCGQEETDCMYADKCDASGKCIIGGPKPLGHSCGDSTATVCNGADTCDGEGTCQSNLVPDGSFCGNLADECNEADKCNKGECVSTTKPDGTMCGAAPSGLCDVGDTCSAGRCIDNVEPAGTVCRAAVGDCDVAETCDGSSKSCPTNDFMAAGTSCGSSVDSPCNNPDTCDGSGTCLQNLEAEGTVCGQEETACMYADKCDVSGSCIVGGPKPKGLSCGDPTATLCNGADTCDGEGTCQPNLAPDGSECGKLEDECNEADKCNKGECVSTTKPDGTMCGAAPWGPCDVGDTCSAGKCIDNIEPADTVCRAAEGDCDVDETCDGVLKTCPIDAFKPVGSACGSDMDTECDNPDTCDGSGTCLDNHVADGSPCGYEGDQCMFADSCSVGECSVGGPKPTTTKCGVVSGVCDVQDYCDGAGSCPDLVADESVECRAADGECDLPEMCDGSNKGCPADSFKPAGEMCGVTGSDLEKCELQDTCDGSGGCKDAGYEPIEYTFKCGTTNFLCGNEVDGSGCTDGASSQVKATQAQCDGLIAAMLNPDINTYETKCPNGNAISHYVIYDCYGNEGIKYELDGDQEIQVTCKSRRLRSNKTDSFLPKFW